MSKTTVALRGAPPSVPTAANAGNMVMQALAAGATPEIIDKILDWSERIESRTARKAFDSAMSEAKAELPVIVKGREMDFGGSRKGYHYEDMATIARAVDPILAKHGLSYRYRTSTKDGAIIVTCIVSHRDGHAEENSLSANPDTSGSKNAIQALGSAQTYLQRYTLKAALGLAASVDDDGNGGNGGNANSPQTAPDAIGELISNDQINELIALCGKAGKKVSALEKRMEVKALGDLHVGRFKVAKDILQAVIDSRAKAEVRQ